MADWPCLGHSLIFARGASLVTARASPAAPLLLLPPQARSWESSTRGSRTWKHERHFGTRMGCGSTTICKASQRGYELVIERKALARSPSGRGVRRQRVGRGKGVFRSAGDYLALLADLGLLPGHACSSSRCDLGLETPARLHVERANLGPRGRLNQTAPSKVAIASRELGDADAGAQEMLDRCLTGRGII